MPLYFAYGSNMDVAAMAQRCPRSASLGPALLHRHRLVIMSEGYASVVRDPRHRVYGLLWDVALADVRALDAYESVATGLYRKALQPVKRLGGSGLRPLQQALVYLGRGDGGGVARPGYLENVLACAEQLEFPAAYLAHIRTLGQVQRRGTPATGGVPSVEKMQRKPLAAQRDSEGNIIVRTRFNSPMDR